MLVTLYNALLQTNQSADETSYHLTGAIDLDGYRPFRSIVGLGQ